jgi:hypothetical protein
LRSWEAAFDKISRREFVEVIESLDVSPPFDFDFKCHLSEVPEFISDVLDSEEIPLQKAFALPGRDVLYVGDTLACISKFLHVVESCRIHANRGALTWALVDAYHASILGARAICAQLGIMQYSVNGRTILVDFRPEFGSPQDSRKFRKNFGNLESPARFLVPQPKHLEQKHVWKLVGRMMRLCTTGTSDITTPCQKIEELSKSSPGAERNAVMYDSIGWRWRDDHTGTDRPPGLSDADINSRLFEVQANMELLDNIYLIVIDHLEAMSAKISLSLDSFPVGKLRSAESYILTS